MTAGGNASTGQEKASQGSLGTQVDKDIYNKFKNFKMEEKEKQGSKTRIISSNAPNHLVLKDNIHLLYKLLLLFKILIS